MKKMILAFLLLSLYGCGTAKHDSNKEKTSSFVNLTAAKELEDGWYLYITIDVAKIDSSSEQVEGNLAFDKIGGLGLDKVNLKYDKLDEFYLPVEDEKGYIVDKIETAMPSYIQSPTYGKEMSTMNEYLTNKRFTKAILLEDIKDLNTTVVKKDDIVELFNKALINTKTSKSKYTHRSESNLEKKSLSNGDILQVAYIASHLGMGACNIEYIYQDGTYLSDISKGDKANVDQIALQKKLDTIEKNLLETQNIDSIESVGIQEIDQILKPLFKKCLGETSENDKSYDYF